ncbi:MAG: glucosaminidase domain-containing protein, partial [Erysipelothrix sp.]|nr:glucosaminidase domain-containing protein [Erysipelothrix sp.]
MLKKLFNRKKICTNHIKIIRSSILLVLVLLTPIVVLAQNSEEVITENTDTVVNYIEVIDNNEEIIDIGKGMEIMPNLEGASFETNDQKDPQKRSLFRANSISEDTPQSVSYVAGGLFWGHLKGTSGTTVDIWKEYSDATAFTYIEPTTNSSGVVPILGEKGDYYKIAISGMTGWIHKNTMNITPFVPSGHYNYYRRNAEGDLIHYINTVGGKNNYAAINQGEAPSYFSGDQYYISFDGMYFYQPTEAGFRNMINNYNAGTRTNSINANNPYINYFQWLPARTQSTLTTADMEKYLTKNGTDNNTQMRSRLYQTSQFFVNNANLYGSNHGLAFANAIHESQWGQSGMAKNRNNFFGHAAYDSSPGSANVYASADIGIANHYARFLNWNYLDTDPKYSTYNGGSVGNKAVGMNVKYASDPYWGEKIASHYYNMDKMAGKKDYKRYTLGTVKTAGSKVYKEARANSGSPYNVKHSGITVAILNTIKEGSNTWYQFTSDPVLDSNKNPLTWKKDLSLLWTKVNYAKSHLYINSNDVTIVSQGSNSKLLPQTNPTSKTP